VVFLRGDHAAIRPSIPSDTAGSYVSRQHQNDGALDNSAEKARGAAPNVASSALAPARPLAVTWHKTLCHQEQPAADLN